MQKALSIHHASESLGWVLKRKRFDHVSRVFEEVTDTFFRGLQVDLDVSLNAPYRSSVL
jgi:hypothetical protein